MAQLKGEKVKKRVEVETKFDFLALSPEQDTGPKQATNARPRKTADSISVPREESWEWVEYETDAPERSADENTCEVAPAYSMDYTCRLVSASMCIVGWLRPMAAKWCGPLVRNCATASVNYRRHGASAVGR